jgi:hypothetical protein
MYVYVENRGGQKHTERRPVLHIVPQQVPRADGGELGESLEEAFGLRAFPDSRGADDARGSLEAHGWLSLSPYLGRWREEMNMNIYTGL